MYRLINARPSPYGRKVAVALHEKQLPFEHVFDLPWADAVETRRHSPLEQLPILLVEGEEPIFDSSFILQWLELRHPSPALLPDSTDERIAALRLQTLGERLMEIAQALIFEQFRPQPSEQAIERATRKLYSGVAHAEQLVAATQLPQPDGAIHLGQIALGTTLAVWEFVVAEGMSPPMDALVWRDRQPQLTKLIGVLEERSSFVATRPQSMSVDIQAEVQ
jgi:glutathione S-transferase